MSTPARTAWLLQRAALSCTSQSPFLSILPCLRYFMLTPAQTCPSQSKQHPVAFADAMVKQASLLASTCAEQGLGSDRILIQLPATFAGIQAAQSLQTSGIDCEVNGVYSLPQAAFAVDSGVAVMVVNVCHINLWYDRNPGAIRDPHVRPHGQRSPTPRHYHHTS